MGECEGERECIFQRVSERERERERERRCETVLDMCIAADNNNDDDGFTTERVGQCLGSVRDAFF